MNNTHASRDKASKLPRDWELGLAVLECSARPGISFSQDQIACACGVTNGAVCNLEKRALRKLRNRLQFTEQGREILEEMRAVLR